MCYFNCRLDIKFKICEENTSSVLLSSMAVQACPDELWLEKISFMLLQNRPLSEVVPVVATCYGYHLAISEGGGGGPKKNVKIF